MATTSNSPFSKLVLGWQVNQALEPEYWLDPKARPGAQPEDALIKVSADAVGCHTAIIAQSGSGKSFFLGRLIEELLIQTRCRCLVFDPNSDFRKVDEIKKDDLWVEASYDRGKRRGRLPHESNRAVFDAEWSKIPKVIKTRYGKEQLKVWLPLVSPDFLAEGLDPMLRANFFHCHAYIRALAPLVHLQNLMAKEPFDLLDQAEYILAKNSGLRLGALVDKLHHEAEQIATVHRSTEEWVYSEALDMGVRLGFNALTLQMLILGSSKAAKSSLQYVSEEGAHFYFSKVRQYQAADVLLTKRQPAPYFLPNSWRLEVIDLPSLKDRSARLLAVNAVLEQESIQVKHLWSQALDKPSELDERRPVFIVVDEAHNLIPAEVRNNAEASLREQFRTIAAEGRKFGLFLVLVSQRPDKLDPFILSECENVAIMKLSNASVLKKTQELLHLEDVPAMTLEQTLRFNLGCGLLVGRWTVGKPLLFYSAARRTTEGGRDLRPEFWAMKPT